MVSQVSRIFPSLESITCVLAVLKKCGSPFFASLIIRTLAFGWITGTRFSNSKTDLSKCPFCHIGPQNLGHIIACPSLLRPLIRAINKELRARGLSYRVPDADCDDLSSIFHSLFPPSPSSPAPLLLMACACDAFQGARNFTFGSRLSLHLFLDARVKLLFKKFGNKFWGMLNPLLQSHASLAPPRRRGRRRRQSPLAVFSSSAPPPNIKDSRKIGSRPNTCVFGKSDYHCSTSFRKPNDYCSTSLQAHEHVSMMGNKATLQGSRQARVFKEFIARGQQARPLFSFPILGLLAYNLTSGCPLPLVCSPPLSVSTWSPFSPSAPALP